LLLRRIVIIVTSLLILSAVLFLEAPAFASGPTPDGGASTVPNGQTAANPPGWQPGQFRPRLRYHSHPEFANDDQNAPSSQICCEWTSPHVLDCTNKCVKPKNR
jgi:hypothetical protein